MPTVSVILPAYNQAQYLSDAVSSVLDGTYPDFEIAIIDDGSTDDTPIIAKRFTDPRVRYIYQENRGLAGARNTGIRNTTGKYIAYLDSDDLFTAEKLEILTKKFEAEPEFGLVAGQNILIGDDGTELDEIFDTPLPEDGAQLLLGNPITVGSVLLRREWQEKAGFFDESLRSYEDWDMWLRLAKLGCKMGWVPKPVYYYRFHNAQMTRDDRQMTTATFAVLDKVFQEPDLPQSWNTSRDEAYSCANLRGAAQAYSANNYRQAKTYLTEAVRLNPELTINQAELLAKNILGWANYSKISDPLPFLEDIYTNLPANLQVLKQRKSQDISNLAMQIAFSAYANGDLPKVRSVLWYAFRQRPQWMLNRGVLSLFIRSLFSKKARNNILI